MTDQEINEAVARKLGWESHPSYIVKNRIDWKTPKGGDRNKLPDYCHDIKAAWEIVEFLNSRNYRIILKQAAPMAICLAFLELKSKKTCSHCTGILERHQCESLLSDGSGKCDCQCHIKKEPKNG